LHNRIQILLEFPKIPKKVPKDSFVPLKSKKVEDLGRFTLFQGSRGALIAAA
jgi:hypothetical protein